MLINTQQAVFQLQLAQGKAWVVTAGDDQVDMGRQLVEQRRHYLKNAARLDPLKIIQHDKQRTFDPRQGISEQITQQLRRQAGSYRQRVEPRRIEIGHLGANVVSQTTEKTQRVVVPRLQRVMHHRRRISAAPVLQQRRLSRAGRGKQQSQGITLTARQKLQQALAEHTIGRQYAWLKSVHQADPVLIILRTVRRRTWPWMLAPAHLQTLKCVMFYPQLAKGLPTTLRAHGFGEVANAVGGK